MDTSETYIKMRIKAIPDLGMGVPPKVIPYNFLTDTVYVDSIGNFYCSYQQGKDDAVIGCQLERQDQLQEMLGDYYHCVAQIYWWKETTRIGDYYGYDYDTFSSMEQLWLAFVMKEKYNKVWNGDEWIE